MAKLKITATETNGQMHDRYQRPGQINGAYVGGTGGLTSQTGRQIQGQSYVAGASSQTCSILAQKGAHKFRVQDALGNKGICTLMNSPNVTSGKMNILLTLNTAAANIAAANVAGGATSTTFTYDTRTSVTGPVQAPRVGDYAVWTSPSANIGGVAQITGVSSGTFTIAATGNVAAVTGVTVNTSTYASKINNKYVWDWYSDGSADSTSGTITFMTSGFNPTRYRYHLAAPDATFIQVQYA